MLHILKRKLTTLRHLLSQLHRLPYLQEALADPNGLGGLQLRLFNAHIPQAYYGIFYNQPPPPHPTPPRPGGRI